LNAYEYRYCSAFPGFKLDRWPPAAEAAVAANASIGTSGTRALPGCAALLCSFTTWRFPH
jgi:hypothetical protein